MIDVAFDSVCALPEGAELTRFLVAKVACCGRCSTDLCLIYVRNCNMNLFMDLDLHEGRESQSPPTVADYHPTIEGYMKTLPRRRPGGLDDPALLGRPLTIDVISLWARREHPPR
jgi:hypothetical protein